MPAAVRPKYDAIWALVGPFCRGRLNDEYADMCQRMLGVLARKRPSPLAGGTAAGWAAGVVRAVGHVNFLGDKSRSPYMTTADIDKGFGVSQATAAAKSKAIRDLLNLTPFDPKWMLPSFMADNPMAYMVAVNGLLMDVRRAPPDIQAEVLARGLVPPWTGVPVEGAPAAPSRQGAARLYTLEAFITQGPISKAFARKNKVISRTIRIRGDQTLADLHGALFAAFDRFDEHMYEFQLGKGPNHPGNKRYALRAAEAFGDDTPFAGTVEKTTLDVVKLKVGQSFGYWFDFGDDWWHQINVVAIADAAPPGTYPTVTARVGESPPQYPDAED